MINGKWRCCAAHRRAITLRGVLAAGCVLLAGTLCMHVLAVLFGAPFFEQYSETWHLAAVVSTTAITPLFSVLDSRPATWGRVLLANEDITRSERALQLVAAASVVGAWLGAFPIPLDWDRPWQRWPVSVVIGAVYGAAAARLAG